MRVHELIARLQSFPKKMQQLPVVTYEGLTAPGRRWPSSLIAIGTAQKPALAAATESLSCSCYKDARAVPLRVGTQARSRKTLKVTNVPPGTHVSALPAKRF